MYTRLRTVKHVSKNLPTLIDIWNVLLYGAETRMLRKEGNTRILEAIEMWLWRMMESFDGNIRS